MSPTHGPWIPYFGEDEEPTLESAVHQAVGAASVCWENPGGAGIFDDVKARWVAEGLLAYIEREK